MFVLIFSIFSFLPLLFFLLFLYWWSWSACRCSNGFVSSCVMRGMRSDCWRVEDDEDLATSLRGIAKFFSQSLFQFRDSSKTIKQLMCNSFGPSWSLLHSHMAFKVYCVPSFFFFLDFKSFVFVSRFLFFINTFS